jgi:hypothetical protein
MSRRKLTDEQAKEEIQLQFGEGEISSLPDSNKIMERTIYGKHPRY